jgi:hypothetical protein
VAGPFVSDPPKTQELKQDRHFTKAEAERFLVPQQDVGNDGEASRQAIAPALLCPLASRRQSSLSRSIKVMPLF